MERTARRNIDVATEELAKIQPKPGEVDKRPTPLELYEEVDVTVRRGFAPRDRAEDARTYHPTPRHRHGNLSADLVDRGTHTLNLCFPPSRPNTTEPVVEPTESGLLYNRLLSAASAPMHCIRIRYHISGARRQQRLLCRGQRQRVIG